jgi:hypothetical protein
MEWLHGYGVYYCSHSFVLVSVVSVFIPARMLNISVVDVTRMQEFANQSVFDPISLSKQ